MSFSQLCLLAFAGLFSASAAQAQWAVQHAPANAFSLTDVQFLDADHGYATGAIGTLIKTVDGGQNWTWVTTGINPSLRNLYFVNADSGYVVGNAGTMAKTTDGGTTWTTITGFNNGNSLNGVWFRDFENGFTTMGDQIHKTTDAGQTWTVAYTYNGPITIFTFRSIQFPTPQIGYAIGGHSSSFGSATNIAKTTDGGQTWTLLPAPANMGATAASAFPDALTGYVHDINSVLHKTTDGGQTWTTATATGMGSFYAMHFLDAQTGFGSGYNTGPQMTTDGGQTWTSQYSSQDTWSGMHFPSPGLGFAVGASNTSAAPLILKYTAPNTSRPEAAGNGICLYPNPSQGAFTIEGLQTHATLRFVNLQGQTVATRQVSGSGRISAADLAAGLYQVHVQTAEGTSVQKLVVE